jgi:hypothetical protein
MANTGKLRVNALIIGAGRSGTTSLYAFLESHSDVCFSNIKEVHFFSIDELYNRGESYYHSFFRKCQGATVIASADTYLLMDHDAISRVYTYNPEMKIIVMLRDPVSRAYSSYNYSVNFGHHQEYAAFLDSLVVEKQIAGEANIVTRNNVGHFYGSLYYEHLRKWTAVFPREQILLLKTSDLKENPQKFSKELCSFLNLSETRGKFEQANAAAVPKSRKLEQFFLDRNNVLRKIIRRWTPRFLKQLIIGSGVVDKLHSANRKEQTTRPLSEEEREKAMQWFRKDLQLLKKEYNIEF